MKHILPTTLALLCAALAFIRCSAADLPPTLTPPSPPTPEIHGAKVFGVHPGHPFLFTVAATGDRPITFTADNLPAGLTLDPATGQITGTAPAAGDFAVTLHAKNAGGETQRSLLIKVGDTLALTPPMGWNSWNCFAGAVTEKDIRSAADVMISSGLANHGWTYINVDDYWQVNPGKGKSDPSLRGPLRNPDGSIHPNPRFPDMKGMADYIHSKGLKAGLYSSPGRWTCGGCVGSYGHEEQDAAQYAAWGYDYLKYDWCSYQEFYQKEDGGKGLPGLEKPYIVMGKALAAQPRDILFSLCQYGWGKVWTWGASVGGNTWRTTGDISDSWHSMMSNAKRQEDIGQYAGPGHWNDPDMLIFGKLGWGHLHETSLTADEQYTHMSLWVLQAAPLLIGCDLTQLDAFTLGLLTNDEVLDVDQDALGKAAHVVHPAQAGFTTIQIWARPLEDGSLAVGLVNTGDATQATLNFSDLQLTGPQKVRDLWRQKDLGSFDSQFVTQVPTHGTVLIRVIKP